MLNTALFHNSLSSTKVKSPKNLERAISQCLTPREKVGHWHTRLTMDLAVIGLLAYWYIILDNNQKKIFFSIAYPVAFHQGHHFLSLTSQLQEVGLEYWLLILWLWLSLLFHLSLIT